MQNGAAEIKLRAERRAGELLAGTEKHPGSRNLGASIVEGPSVRLADVGVTYHESHRWQREAAVPGRGGDYSDAEVTSSG